MNYVIKLINLINIF